MKLAANEAPVIRRADASDYQNLTMVLTAAFLHGDFAPYLIPDLTERSVRYYPYFELIADHALTHGRVDLIMDEQSAMPAAAASWYQIDNGRLPADLPDYDAHLAAAVGPALPRFFALDQTMHQRHPRTATTTTSVTSPCNPAFKAKGSDPGCSTITTSTSTPPAGTSTWRRPAHATSDCIRGTDTKHSSLTR